MDIPLHITQTDKLNGKITDVRVESVDNYPAMTANISHTDVRWFMKNTTAHFFTKIVGSPKRIPVLEFGDDGIRSLANDTEDDNLLNLDDIEIEPELNPLDFKELQQWVEQMENTLIQPSTFE